MSLSPRTRLWLGALALLALLGVVLLRQADRSAPATPATAIAVAKPAPAPTAAPRVAVTGEVVLRPLATDQETARHAWTREDAKDPEVIEKLAHNPEEFTRMMEENTRIKRRQLVYRKEPLALLLEQARASGQPLARFTLPALDGKEVEVEVLETRVEGHRGAVMGRIAGRLDSLACVGFSGACESFNIMSPEDGLFIAADSREPGEVILKEIDPAVYSPMACGGPLTAQN